MEPIIIKNLPLPPTVNHLYINVNRFGRSFRAPSQQYKDYKKEMSAWALQRMNFLKELNLELNKIIAQHKMIRVDSYFHFEHERIWTKKGKPKKMDSSNRVKPLHDQFSEWVGIDDRYFWSGFHEKITCEPGKERTTVVLLPFMPRHDRDLKTELI